MHNRFFLARLKKVPFPQAVPLEFQNFYPETKGEHNAGILHTFP